MDHEDYEITGHMEWAIRAGVQSATVDYLGGRKIVFKDGCVITHNYPQDKIYGLFMGTFGHQLQKRIIFTDVKNGIEAYYDHAAYMFKK